MKKVFSNSKDVIHVFAQQTQSEGRSSNVFFVDNKIYSYGYHYLLGEFIENKKGEKAILINNKGYSSTTSGHIYALTSATSQYKQFFTMSCDTGLVFDQVSEMLKKLPKARKKEKYIDGANALFSRLNHFIEWSGNKEAKTNPLYKKIVKMIEVFNGADMQQYLADKAKEIARDKRRAELAEKKAKAKRLEDAKEQLLKWLNFETNYFYGNHILGDYLRINGDYIETTQRVSIPIQSAMLLYSKIVKGEDIKGYDIEGYKVISFNGVLQVGCHKINVENMHSVGKVILNN